MPRPNSIVRSLPYPMIEDGNFSFPEARYSAEPRMLGDSGTKIILSHKLTGAPLVEQMIAKGQAQYACLVSVPKTGYRKLHISADSEQEIEWDLGVVGEPPMLGPVILFVGDSVSHKLNKNDGVAEIWRKKTVEFPKGARLARARYLRPMAAIENLMSLRRNDDLASGSFEVTTNTNNGFGFTVCAAPDVYKFIQNPHVNSELRASVLIHAVSECFHILASEYGLKDDGEGNEEQQWEQFASLNALSDWLLSMEHPHWSDEDFEPSKIATSLYPIPIPEFDEED